MSNLGQKALCLYHLDNLLTDADDNDENEIVLPGSFAYNIYHLINSQEIKEPMMDVVFFVGKPDKETLCHHVLVNSNGFKMMELDPNIHMMDTCKFDGVWKQNDKEALEPVFNDGHAFCKACGKRLKIKAKPHYCPKCGRVVAWDD